MTTFGISMVKNEADVIEGTLRHMAGEVDYLIVADNGSTDSTRRILDRLEYQLPLTVVDDPDVAYYQAVKMTRLAERAAALGAGWVVPFDADELWRHPDGPIRDVLGGFPEDVTSCTAVLYNHLRTGMDVDDTDPFRSMVWRSREPGALPKVAFRWQHGATVHQGNHGVDLPHPGITGTGLEVRHFPIRSAAQFVRKVVQGGAAYAATDLSADQGAHWRGWAALHAAGGDQVIHDIYRDHWWYPAPAEAGLVNDPAPYRRLA